MNLLIALLRRLRRFFSPFAYPIRVRTFHSGLSNIFSNRSVALVGGAPSIGRPLSGTDIDSHDLVVRINMPRNLDVNVFGRRTDVVFLGATVSDPQYLAELSSKLQPNSIVISKLTNKGNLDFLEQTHFLLYFPNDLPVRVTNKVCNLVNQAMPAGVPRSGFICLATLLLYSKPKKITIYGMSKEVEEAYQTLGSSGERIMYNQESLLTAHCNPLEEIALMKLLVSSNDKSIKWKS